MVTYRGISSIANPEIVKREWSANVKIYHPPRAPPFYNIDIWRKKGGGAYISSSPSTPTRSE